MTTLIRVTREDAILYLAYLADRDSDTTALIVIDEAHFVAPQTGGWDRHDEKNDRLAEFALDA